MQQDIVEFPELSEDEQEAFLQIIGLLALLDSIQTDYAGHMAGYLTDSSVNALMIILAQQEVVHNHSYSYILSSVVTKDIQEKVFEYWKTEPKLIARNEFVTQGYKEFAENPTIENMLKSIIFDVILEGLFFYSGFAFFYNLARNRKMVSTSTMINYINRDEQVHVGLFANIFKEVIAENPEYDTESMKEFALDTFRTAAELEIEWAEHIIGNKIDGITMKDMTNYIQFTANLRCNQMGFGKRQVFPKAPTKNPLRWIKAYEDVDLGKTDFFEQKPRNYAKTNTENGFDDL